jgi:hypothetical protein
MAPSSRGQDARFSTGQREFDSRWSYHWRYRIMAVQRSHKPPCGGSSPPGATNASKAQMDEQAFRKCPDVGSSPT